jgi:hypothetical protein
VTALVGYFDDSRNDDNGLLVLAGYLAPIDAWDMSFAPQWRQALDAAPHLLSEFKASDCRHGIGEFKSWTYEERLTMTQRLVSLIVNPQHRLYGIGCAVLTPRMQDRKQKRRNETFSYHICVNTIMAHALFAARKFPNSSSMQFFLDAQAKKENLLSEAFRGAREAYAHNSACKLYRPQFGNSHLLPPLQAADILAYETLKEIKSTRKTAEAGKQSTSTPHRWSSALRPIHQL